eukprot:NODE_25677_length_578_cov_4.898004.p1 GENE.NODE_25677_length_578_cov_4.898004~~NODE_25677_length_578_cov_4.898004.p1  ORF type:complete len:125 (-),score=13.84 NODE_25677_length_578_cov_4.898004:160-534(-)
MLKTYQSVHSYVRLDCCLEAAICGLRATLPLGALLAFVAACRETTTAYAEIFVLHIEAASSVRGPCAHRQAPPSGAARACSGNVRLLCSMPSTCCRTQQFGRCLVFVSSDPRLLCSGMLQGPSM